MKRPDVIEAMVPVVREFERLGVQYYVGGSVASTVHGHVRTTQDVDLVADLTESHVGPLVEALRHDYYISGPAVSEAVVRRSCFNTIYLPISFKVDVFVVKNREYDRVALQRAQEKAFDDDDPALRFRVAAVEDIALAKLEWFRIGGEMSERQWLDVTRVLQIHAETIDRPYLQEWAAELGIADLLERAWQEVESPGERRLP